jgi:hypothetical protein
MQPSKIEMDETAVNSTNPLVRYAAHVRVTHHSPLVNRLSISIPAVSQGGPARQGQLPLMDSNHDLHSQSVTSCHWTKGQVQGS